MRFLKPSCRYLIAAFFFISCSHLQKVTVGPTPVKAQPNREAYPRITDIIHTKLEISFNWDSAFVIGKAYITAKPYSDTLTQVILNAVGFKINQIGLLNRDRITPLNYSYDGKLLTIQLDKAYAKDQPYKLFINYVAMPNKLKVGKDIHSADSRGLYFINPTGKDKSVPRQVWSQGESECNSTWFPTINGPQEKMTQDISLTVPKNMKTLSNGELYLSATNGDGSHTESWRMDKPHSTYLTMIAAGDFIVTKDKWMGKEVSYYMEPMFAANARLIFGRTPEMMTFFSRKLQMEYPWKKYSQIVVRDFVSGAMENTTATVFFDKMNMDAGEYLDENYEEVIAHELFHQWFGDLVTAGSWANLSLNESFAAYGEYLWNEYKYGRDYADYYGMRDQQAYLSNPLNRLKSLIRYNYGHPDELFDNVSYEKGARVLHMLRKTVGNVVFFKALNLYLRRFAYATADIQDLRKVFEEASGQDLNWFFKQWFLSPGHPRLAIDTRYDKSGGQAIVSVRQVQDLASTPLYKLPMAIDIYANGKIQRNEIVVDQQSQIFKFPVPTEPDLVNVDAEKYLLCEKLEDKTLDHYIFQYENAPLFLDRFEAVGKFISKKKEKTARAEMVKALGDKNWYIRKLAVDFITNLSIAEKASVYETVKNLALHDERSYVRAAAITALKKWFNDYYNADVYNAASSDKAPSVIKALGGF